VILKTSYEVMLESLLKQKIPENDKESLKQIKSFTKAKDKIFEFLIHPEIPSDNNGSERAIRNIKVKLKVSGQFKSLKGAESYANLRSIIDTSKKRNMNPLQVLSKISNNLVIF
jgi:transposase